MYEIEKAIYAQSDILLENWGQKINPVCRKNLKNKKSVLFIGTGSSYHVALWARWMCHYASKGKLKSQAMQTWDYIEQNKNKPAKDPAQLEVFISHRGYLNLTQEAMKLSTRGNRILICSNRSPACDTATIYTCEPETAQAHTKSLVAAMSACSELVGLLLEKTQHARILELRQKTAEVLRRLLTNQDLQLEMKKIPLGKNHLHLLGGGPFQAIAQELELKIREIVHFNANSYNLEEFLHGPLCSVESKDIVLLLHNNKAYLPTLKRALRSAKALKAITVETICQIERKSKPDTICWEALLSLCWGQVFCVVKARQRKINPDLNRTNEIRYKLAQQLAK